MKAKVARKLMVAIKEVRTFMDDPVVTLTSTI
jgi:hypothetical protein